MTIFSHGLFLQNVSYWVFHRVMNMPLIKLIKILVLCHLSLKNLGQSLQISFTFKSSFVCTLLSGSQALLVTNSINLSLISNWFTPCSWICVTLISHYLPHYNNCRPTLSIFFAESKEIQSKLHLGIVLTLSNEFEHCQ